MPPWWWVAGEEAVEVARRPVRRWKAPMETLEVEEDWRQTWRD